MNKLKGLKEDLNKAIRNLAEAQAEGIETRSLEEQVEKIRDEIVAFEDEIRANTITITDEVNNKGVEKMENNKFGKVVLTVLRTIGKGAKKVADFIAKPFKTAANKIKETSFDTAYDNIWIISRTLE